ncbi:MAG: hypothetical protein ACOYIT_07530 [Christensenellales bacterium]|jgi:hypothetical protein
MEKKERLWIRLIRKNKIVKDAVVPVENGDWFGALSKACHEFDLSVPVLLNSHIKDWNEFHLARFLPGDFLDSFNYDRMEVEGITDESRPMSRDPKNA